jgi:hypothetical protein
MPPIVSTTVNVCWSLVFRTLQGPTTATKPRRQHTATFAERRTHQHGPKCLGALEKQHEEQHEDQHEHREHDLGQDKEPGVQQRRIETDNRRGSDGRAPVEEPQRQQIRCCDKQQAEHDLRGAHDLRILRPPDLPECRYKRRIERGTHGCELPGCESKFAHVQKIRCKLRILLFIDDLERHRGGGCEKDETQQQPAGEQAQQRAVGLDYGHEWP